jgi:hypothetical protein
MKDDILPAVPLFIFMGYMTEQAGLMERLFLALRNLLAPLRGSLYLAVILTSTIFAMATGIVGAAVTVLGIMAGPVMVRTGYNATLSAGAIAAGGHKYGFRKNWGKSEFAQDALQALYPETRPVHVSSKVLEEVRGYLEHNTKYLATYGGQKLDRATVTRALQKLGKVLR